MDCPSIAPLDVKKLPGMSYVPTHLESMIHEIVQDLNLRMCHNVTRGRNSDAASNTSMVGGVMVQDQNRLCWIAIYCTLHMTRTLINVNQLTILEKIEKKTDVSRILKFFRLDLVKMVNHFRIVTRDNFLIIHISESLFCLKHRKKFLNYYSFMLIAMPVVQFFIIKNIWSFI